MNKFEKMQIFIRNGDAQIKWRELPEMKKISGRFIGTEIIRIHIESFYVFFTKVSLDNYFILNDLTRSSAFSKLKIPKDKEYNLENVKKYLQVYFENHLLEIASKYDNDEYFYSLAGHLVESL